VYEQTLFIYSCDHIKIPPITIGVEFVFYHDPSYKKKKKSYIFYQTHGSAF